MNTLALGLPFTQIGIGLTHTANALLARVERARKFRQTQRYLAQLDDRMLSDIGVSRAQIEFEIERAVRKPGKR